MKNLFLALTVGAVLALGSALAQGSVMFESAGTEGDLLATELIGADLYTTATTLDQNRFQVDTVPDDWEQIASISNLVLGMDGQVRGVLVDVGGFLGIGARTVMLTMDSIRIATQTDSDRVYAVINATREELEAAPEYEVYDRTGMMNDDATAQPVDAEGEPVDPMAQPRLGVAEPQEGFSTIEWSTLSVDQLRSAAVYDVNNERVADISDVLIGTEDNVEAVLIDIGGFLGLGGRTVAIAMDQLEIQGNEDATDLRVYLAITEEQLEALPEYDPN
jgi:hypothetical protein